MKKIITILATVAIIALATSCKGSSDPSRTGTRVKYEILMELGHKANIEYTAHPEDGIHKIPITGSFSFDFLITGDFSAFIRATKDPSEKEDVEFTVKIYKNNKEVRKATGKNEVTASANICNCPDD